MPGGIRAEALAAPIFVLLWSTGFIGAKLGLPDAEPMTLLTLRFGLVAGALGLWVWIARAPWPDRRQCRDAALIGALLHGVYLGGVFQAIALGLEAGLSALIVGAQPLLTALIARRFLGEVLGPSQWLGMLLGFAGVSLVVARKIDAGLGDWRGVVLCIVALIAISAASVLQKTRGQQTPMRTGALIQFLAAVAVTAGLALVFETGRVNWTGTFVFALGWLVVVLSLGAVSLLYLLLRRGGASNVASLFFLVPGATAVIAWALFGETLGWVETGGVAITALGVVLVNRAGITARRGPEP